MTKSPALNTRRQFLRAATTVALTAALAPATILAEPWRCATVPLY